MSWTYSGNPSSSDKDAVRFLIGDTDETFPLVQDEEIQFALGTEANVYAAAAKCCEALAARFSREADRRMGSVSVQSSQKASAYKEMARDLRKKAGLGNLPYSGASDSAPVFTKGMMDYV